MGNKTNWKEEHLHRIVDTLKAVNQLLVIEKDTTKLIRKSCEILVETRGYYFAWIGLFDRNKNVTDIESAGQAQGFEKLKADAIKGILPEMHSKALNTKEFGTYSAKQRDCQLDIKDKKWTSFVVPLQIDMQTEGLLCAAVPDKDAMHPKEKSTLQDIANNIGFAISSAKEKQDMAQLIDNAPDGHVLFDNHLNITSVNPAFCQIFNTKKESIVGHNFIELVKGFLPKNKFEQFQETVNQYDEKIDIENLEFDYQNKTYSISLKTKSFSKYRMLIVRDISKDKIEQLILQQSEAKYRNLINSLNDSIFILQDGLIKYANPILCKLSEYSEDELINSEFIKFVAEPETESIRERHSNKRSYKEGQKSYQSIAKTKSGKHIPVEVTTIPVEFEGSPALQVILRDISIRKKALQQLQESEERYKFLSQSTFEGIIIHDKGIIIDVNQALLDMSGYMKNDLLGKSIFSFLGGDKAKKAIEQSISQTSVEPFVVNINLKNKEIAFVQIEAREISYNGKSVRIAGLRNVSKQYQLEQSINEAREKMNNLMDHLPGMAYTCLNNENWDMEFMSQGCVKLTGFRPEDFITAQPLTYNDIIHDDDKQYVWDTISNATAKNLPFELEYRIITKEGVEKWVWERGRQIIVNDKIVLEGFTSDITQWKQAERELIEAKILAEENEQKFVSFMNFLPGSAYIKDDQSNFLFVNRFMEKNLNAADWIGQNSKKVISPANLNRVIEDDKITFVQGRHKFEEQIEVADRGTRDFLTYQFTINKKNKLPQLGGISIDISDRKKLESRNTMLSKAIASSPVSVVITNAEGEIEYVNPFFEEKTGYKLDEVKGKNPRILKSDKQSNEFYKNLWDTISAGKTWAGEFHNKRKNGELFWEQSSISPVINTDGQIVQYVAIKEDVTEIKRTLNELEIAKERTERKNKKIVEQKNEIQFHNERLESLFRISNLSTNSTQELLDFALHEAITLTKSKIGYIYFYNEETKQFTLNTWSNEETTEHSILNAQTTYELDETGFWGDAVRQRKSIIFNNNDSNNPRIKEILGSHVTLNTLLTIPIFSDNKIVAVAGVANKSNYYDQSDVRQLTLLMDNVWKISERISLMANLQAAKDRAEESDRLKSAFLANMSHEIRTPMNGILGFTDLLKEPELSGEQQQAFIEIIQKSGERMLNTIGDIINISKIESGSEEVRPVDLNLTAFLNDIRLFFLPETNSKGLELNLVTDKSNSSVILFTDPDKLNSILTNLIKNAIKFTHKGNITFGYFYKENSIEFYVRDTGMGIPENRQKAIFERFVQADIADSRVFEGSGLGLSISKSYTEMLNGTILLESEEGIGTSFVITLPLNNQHNLQQPTIVEFGGPSVPVDKKLKILIAEDDEVSVSLLKLYIKKIANEIIIAANGREAIELARNHPDIDLILMDIKMPEIDGFEATEKIREFNPGIKIIAQTAFALPDDNRKAFEVGCNDFLTKPIPKKALLEAINNLFLD